MAALDVTEVDAIEDLAPKWRYVVYLPNLPNGVDAPDPLLVGTPQITHMKVGLNQQFQGSAYVSYPNFLQSATLSLEFHEPNTYKTREYFIAWRKLIVDPEGMYWGLPEGEFGYKQLIAIQQYNTLGDLVSTLYFMDCVPDDAVNESLGEESGYVTYTIPFSVGSLKTIMESE